MPIDALLLDCLADPAFAREHAPFDLTGGYDFWNARWRHRDGMEIAFETADYGAMREHERRAAGTAQKRVLPPNGNLCAGWQPSRDILWRDAPLR
ncbi:MAG: hypothetical protein V4801_28740 [Burkholderia gladioli]